jgi:hypothetical protein
LPPGPGRVNLLYLIDSCLKQQNQLRASGKPMHAQVSPVWRSWLPKQTVVSFMLAFWYALGVRATLLLFCALGMGVFMGNLQWGFVRTQPCQGQELVVMPHVERTECPMPLLG